MSDKHNILNIYLYKDVKTQGGIYVNLNINTHTPDNIQNFSVQSNSLHNKEIHFQGNQEHIDALLHAAKLLANDEIKEAEKIIKEKYPFIPIKRENRKATKKQLMEQFFRDGFIDRYSGKKLINPGMLLTMSVKNAKSISISTKLENR